MNSLRKKIAIWIFPDVEKSTTEIRLIPAKTNLIVLSDVLAAQLKLTHWSISGKISSKCDFINRLMNGGDRNTATYEAVMRRFDVIWPDDLEWPSHIPRPAAAGQAA